MEVRTRMAVLTLGSGSYALVLEGKRHLYYLPAIVISIWDSRSALYDCRHMIIVSKSVPVKKYFDSCQSTVCFGGIQSGSWE